MTELTTRITMPASARKGEIIEIKVLARHIMERAIDAVGLKPSPRKIIHTFRAFYAGEEIFSIDLSTGIASNPYVSFTTMATETGVISFQWLEDGGLIHTRAQTLVVS
jgi:sulfur-oxidizing protein SoxZ